MAQKNKAVKPQDPNWVKVDGHSFNKASVLSYGTLAKFLAAANDEDNKDKKNESAHKEAWFAGDPDRVTKLTLVWTSAGGAMEAPKKTKDVDAIKA